MHENKSKTGFYQTSLRRAEHIWPIIIEIPGVPWNILSHFNNQTETYDYANNDAFQKWKLAVLCLAEKNN